MVIGDALKLKTGGSVSHNSLNSHSYKNIFVYVDKQHDWINK